MDPELVRLVAVDAVLQHARVQPTVVRRQRIRLGMTAALGTRLHRLLRRGLPVRIVARTAFRVVRLIRREILDQRPHLMAGQALARVRPDRAGQLGRRGLLPHLHREVVTRGAVDREIAHLPEPDPGVLVTPGLPARLVRGSELVQPRGMALHAFQTLQRRVVRLHVDPVPGRVRDLPPLFGVALDVALCARRVGHARVRRQLLRLLDDLLEPHLAALDDVRVMTGLAPEPPVRTLRESLIRILHEVALQAELVVVLHVVVGPVHEDRAYGQCRQDNHTTHHLHPGGESAQTRDELR